ncbi:unnamed protein product [Phytomonas sp. EM1]|nr:unnamed protein product [Phytomonas sp. EM1]|eukprot:CCW61410.1 unnamed protein product [Phytomonas sp. isolate EM1]
MTTEFAVEKEILAVSSFFCKVDYPYQPLYAETKEYLDAFFRKDGFVILCDRVFGRLHDSNFHEESPCWMDIANNSPNSSMASALFRFLAPSTPFINLLDSFSLPSVEFSTKAKSSWKYESIEKPEESPAKYTVDFPLSTLYRNSFSLLGEPNDVSLYKMPRSKCPPLLLVPFWIPPLVTRKEVSSKQIMTSLPCLPLPYFILRMFCYAMRRCEKHGSGIISRRALGVIGLFHHFRENLLSFFHQKAAIEFPFYHRVLTAFIQYYTTPTLFRNLSSKIAFEEIMWTSADTIAALLICSPVLLSHRNISQPALEWHRGPVYDPSAVAQLLCTTPFLTEIFITMTINSDDKNRYAFSLRNREFQNDSLCKCSNDIIDIYSSFYRNCLISLRECLLSLDGFPCVRRVHLNNLLELWLILMNPLSRKGEFIDDRYVLRHFEAYSYITIDVLEMFAKSSLIETLDGTGISLLSRCLQILSNDNFKRLISALQCENSEKTALPNVILKNCVLNWAEDQDLALQMANFSSDKTCSLAAHVYALLERKSLRSLHVGIQKEVEICLTYIEQIFPISKQRIEKWRGMLNSGAPKNIPIGCSVTPFHNVSTAHILSETDKSNFFKGYKQRRVVCLDPIRFPTKSDEIYGRNYHLFDSTMRQEFPLLIGFTIFCDALLNKLTDILFSSLIQKCDNGHNLWLVHSRNYSCCNHYSEMAIWECSICEKAYGMCCRSGPTITIKGERLHLASGSNQTKLCSWCGEIFLPNGLFYVSHENNNLFLCPNCASRPFKPWCTRWIAAYKTWSYIFVILLFFLVVWVYLNL